MRITVAGRAPASAQNTGPRRLFWTQGRVVGSQARTARNAPAPAAKPRIARIAPATRRRRAKSRRAGRRKSASAAAAERHGIALSQKERNGLLLGHRESRDPVGRIALEEVEDLVAAGVEPRRERRPGHRRLRRDRRRQRGVAAAGLERGEVRELPRRQHFLDDGRVDAVEAQDDDPARRLGRRERGENQQNAAEAREDSLHGSHDSVRNRRAGAKLESPA